MSNLSWQFWQVLVLLLGSILCFAVDRDVTIFHLIDNKLWGEVDGSALQGNFTCPTLKGRCEIVSTDLDTPSKNLHKNLVSKYHLRKASLSENTITMGLYNIHTWGTLSQWPHHPDKCALNTDLNIAESEESYLRFKKLFSSSFPAFDGNSTTHPSSSIQRSYITEFTFTGNSNSNGNSNGNSDGNGKDTSKNKDKNEGIEKGLLPSSVVPFSQKIKAAAYIASTCHHGGSKGPPLREALVSELEIAFRVDSLGKCHQTERTSRNEGQVRLKSSEKPLEQLQLKRSALAQYQFYLAFENTIEPGYVTEKVFDALKAGTVPVYLGPSDDCRRLLPHPDAAIFADDFIEYRGRTVRGGVEALAAYLIRLSGDKEAYEKHTRWRDTFDASKLDASIREPWACRLCKWASDTSTNTDASTKTSSSTTNSACEK